MHSLMRENDEMTAIKIKSELESRHNITLGLKTVRVGLKKLKWKYGITR